MMMVRLTAAVLGLVVVALATVFIAATAVDANDVTNDNDQQQCGVYLAISSTSTVEETKWGLYAGKSITPNSVVGYPDLAVNIFDLKANAAHMTKAMSEEHDEDRAEYLEAIAEFLESFIWVPDAAGGKFELSRAGRTVTAIPGAGVLGGFNAKLTNAAWNHSAAYFRPAMGDETNVAHPGRGAYTPFYNIALTAKIEIMQGAEIFLDYGENWEEEETKEDLQKDDFGKLDETVEKMMGFFKKHEGDLNYEAKQAIYNFLAKDVMNAAVGVPKGRKVSALLPSSPDDLRNVLEAGGSLAYSQPSVYRKVEWLEEHGRCLDNLRPGPSTIPNAGRGAFATRSLSAGSAVAPLPLVHIPDKTVLNMHDAATPGGQQLLLNYCLGHPQSTMVFFPTGSVAGFINHDANPNAKLVWSDHPLHQKLWYGMDPEALLGEEHMYTGLMMEVVAIRDIKEGEEVTIDYQPEWVAAWTDHVNRWNDKLSSGQIETQWPVQAAQLNDEYRNQLFKTEVELAEEPYPANVMLKSFLMIQESDNSGDENDPKIWGEPVNGTAFDSDNLFDCSIVGHTLIEEDGPNTPAFPYNYTIRWINNKGRYTYVKHVPHNAFVFVNKPGTSDQFVKDPFRHYIGIPDDIFPQGPWRNVG